MKEHFEWLGFKVRDVITGFEGVVESICFDLYGCVQAAVKPGLDEKGQLQDGRWFDTKRLAKTSDAPVMAVPAFIEVPGPSEKPAFQSMPTRG